MLLAVLQATAAQAQDNKGIGTGGRHIGDIAREQGKAAKNYSKAGGDGPDIIATASPFVEVEWSPLAAQQYDPNSPFGRCMQIHCTTGNDACFKARCSPITFGCRTPCSDIYSTNTAACVQMCQTIGDDSSTCAAEFAREATAGFRTCWNSDNPAACGDTYRTAAATAFNRCKSRGSTEAIQKVLPEKNVEAVGRIGTITKVKGSPSVTRGGVKITLREGGSVNIGDTISTGSNERVDFTSDDGEIRAITSESTLTLERRSGKDAEQGPVEKVKGTLETIFIPSSSVTAPQSQAVIGGKLAITTTRSDAGENGIEYKRFSHVRYEFDDVEDRVIVFEGRVDATDPRTGERTTITQGRAFTLKVGRPLREGRITSFDPPSTPALLTPKSSPVNTRLAAPPSPSPSGPATRSSFANDSEGWSGGSFPDNGPYDSVIARVSVRWNQGAGRSGGAISIVDPGPGNFFFEAPAAFLGNKQAFYGGELRYDLRSEGGELFDEADVILLGGGLVLVYRAPGRPTSTWTSVAVPLTESAWKVDRPAGRAPTRAEFERALASIAALRIRGEYRNGPDTGWLGNVSLVLRSGSTTGFEPGRDTAPPPPVQPPPSAQPQHLLSGSWQGTWKNTRGESGPFVISLEVKEDGSVVGTDDGQKIIGGRRTGDTMTWTLRQADGKRWWTQTIQILDGGNTLVANYTGHDDRGTYTGGGTLRKR
jgi:alkaline phosphatase D